MPRWSAIAGAIIKQRTGTFDPGANRDPYQEALRSGERAGRFRLAPMMANHELSLAISATFFGLTVGFLAGYALRAYISYRRKLRRVISVSRWWSGWVEDFHLRAIEHARHTTNPLARKESELGVRWLLSERDCGCPDPIIRQEPPHAKLATFPR